ncbi:uncharacterized protein LOC131071570 [Cryptomeria japonica]|uniref:uncharacterized protein LOC131071570 n=1 Tax=Cryptomeria japonica TaxID=3369 RepID=UPI0027DA79B2|nr:uncharacterized protein LOC131071570 [Cryptomeria japonica]
MNLHNLALGSKLAWKMYKYPQKIWCKILSRKYLDSTKPERIFTLANSKGGSPIWRFIWESRRIISEHLTWKIGNDKKARFWRDSWNGDTPLAEAFDDQDWVNQVEASVGPFVADYMHQMPKSTTLIIWKKVGDWNQANGKKLEELLINKKKIHYNCEEDSLIWCVAKSGMYKVQLGYELQRHREKDTKWPGALCWNKSVLPKAGVFLWIALHGRILTGERLKLSGISCPSICTLCKGDGEMTEHFLFWCPYAKQCWDWLLGCL